MKNNLRIAINALVYGLPIEIDGRTYKLFNPGDKIPLPSFMGEAEDYWLGVECSVERDDTSQGKCYLGSEMLFCDMISKLSKTTDEEAVKYAMDITLNESVRGKLNERE